MVRPAVLLLLTLWSLCAQSPAPLPRFDAETLAGQKLTMPAAAQGHQTLLIIGFTHGSGPHCADWAKRLDSEFPSTAVEKYSVVFLEDAPRLVRGMAIHGIKSGVAKDRYDHYLIVTEHEKDVKAAVHFQAEEDPYLVLLGPDGAIRWTFHGSVGDDPVKQIRALLP